MVVVHFLNLIIWLAMFLSLTSSLGAIAKKTKLCGDEACSEKLFEGKFHRSSLANHESFLSPNENDIVRVYAIKFSDRTDLMEGALVREPARKGNFFSTHINLDDYVEFLKNAVESNKTMFMISRDPHDHPSHKLLGIKTALPELIKDYEVNAERLSVERQSPVEKIDYAALGYFSDTEGHGHSHNYGHGHSYDHGLSHDHEHYHDRGIYVNSQEHIRTMQQTLPPVVLSSETATVPAHPAMNVPTNKPQQAPTGAITSTQQQDVRNLQVSSSLDSEFNVVSEIPIQQNVMHEAVTLVSLSDSGSTPNITPDVSETVVSRIPSVMEDTSSMLENFPISDTIDISFAEGGNLPKIESSPKKTPPIQNIVNPEKLLPTQSLQPVSTQQVNTELSPSKVINTPSSAAVLESNLPPTPINTSQTNFSPSVNPSLPNPSYADIPLTSDRTPPVPVNNAHSDPLYTSSSSSLERKHHIIESEIPSPSDTAAVPTDEVVLPVSVFPHTEPTTATSLAPQFDPVTASSEFGSTMKMKMEVGLEEKNIETTTVNLPLESPPVSTASILPLDSTFSHAINSAKIENTPHIEQKTQEDPTAKIDRERNNADRPIQTEDEVKTDIMEEDGLGYCVKGKCDKVYNNPVVDEKIETGYLFVIGRWLSKLIGIARYMLPSPLSNIDDAGVLVTFFVPICLLIHLLRMLIFADTCDRDNFDRRTLHNALTTIRQREIQIKLLHAEMEKRKNTWNIEMDEKFENLQSEMNELKAKYHMLEEENDNLKAETDETSLMLERERRKCRDLTQKNENLEEKNELLTKQSSEVHTTVEVLHKENERLISELAKKNAQLIRLESDANSHSLEIKNLKDHLKTSLSENKLLHKRVEELQNETVQLSEIINEIHDSGNVTVRERSSVDKAEDGEEDINGKNGWSDFDEDDMDNPATEISERPKKDRVAVVRFSPAEIMEIAKLRVQLKNVEADLDQAKLTLEKHLNERDHLMRKVEFAEADAAKRLKEVEAKEAERIEAHNQFKRILGMVEEREAKLRNTEELTEKLRNEVIKWQEEVRRLEDQKKAVEFKLLEASQELKRLRAEYTKLETRNFHEMRQCKQTLAALQQQSLEQVHLSNPSSNMLDNANVLNISPSSSDRDYSASHCSGLVAQPLLSHVRPLWDDEPPEIFSSRAESSQMKKTDPLLNDVKPENGNINHNRGSKQRRSIREREHNIGVSVDGMQSRNKKEGRRMRSRSHGRHPFRTDYFPILGMPGYRELSPDLSPGIILNKQNSKSGTLYYSSGGSNDGRSPPPEMALLSGVPPPGPMIKKPMPRPKSSTEPLERR